MSKRLFGMQPITQFLIELEAEEEYTTPYVSMRLPYANSEYLPLNLIQEAVKYYFPSSELLMMYNERHYVYKIMVKNVLNDYVKNWEYNRPPDMARCPDIATSIYLSKKPIDTMIYLSFNNKKEVFEVLDGIHRITALRILKRENENPIDLLCSTEYSSNGNAEWLLNQYMLVNIRFNASKGELVEAFENLNKCQAVPELYVRDPNKEKQGIINAIANEWYVKYKRHFSSSNNPVTGNTNRNNFVSLLDKIYDKYNIDESTSDRLRALLDGANAKVKANVPTKASIDARAKCIETGCYLFLHKNDKLEKLI